MPVAEGEQDKWKKASGFFVVEPGKRVRPSDLYDLSEYDPFKHGLPASEGQKFLLQHHLTGSPRSVKHCSRIILFAEIAAFLQIQREYQAAVAESESILRQSSRRTVASELVLN